MRAWEKEKTVERVMSRFCELVRKTTIVARTGERSSNVTPQADVSLRTIQTVYGIKKTMQNQFTNGFKFIKLILHRKLKIEKGC